MVLQMVDSTPFSIMLYSNDEYVYPEAAVYIGYGIAMSSVLMIPILLVKTIVEKPGGAKQV